MPAINPFDVKTLQLRMKKDERDPKHHPGIWQAGESTTAGCLGDPRASGRILLQKARGKDARI
jgi:hypothetical protein